MMQKKLLNKTSLNLFLFTLRKNLGISLIASVIVAIFSPFLILRTVNNYLDSYHGVYSFSSVFSFGAPALAVACCGLFVLLLYIDFSYLYSKSASDAFHSMPIKRTELLISKFAGAYIASLIPLAVGYFGFVMVLAKDEVVGSFSALFTALLFTAFMMIFCGAFTLVFIISAGSLFDAIVSFLALNIGLPIILALIQNLCSTNLYGFYYESKGALLSSATPFAYSLVSLAEYCENPNTYELFTVGSVITVVVIMAVFTALNIFLYKRRKSEKVTASYAFGFMPIIIGVVVSIISYAILSGLFADNNDLLSIAGIIGALLGSVIYNLVTNRGFKKIKTAFIIGGVAVALVIFTNLAINLDIFGYEKYVPKEKDIERVTIHYNAEDMEIEEKALVTSLHSKIVKAHNDTLHDSSIYDADSIWITYELKSGRTVNRQYSMSKNIGTAEKTAIINKYLPKTLQDELEQKANAQFFQIFFNKYVPNKYTYENYSFRINRAEMQKLMDAYCKDLSELEFADLDDADFTGSSSITIEGFTNANTSYDYCCYNKSFSLNANYEFTMEFMDKYKAYLVSDDI